MNEFIENTQNLDTPATTTTNVIDVTADNFVTAVIEKSKQVPVLLDFWADWCEPCKNLTPLLEQIAAENSDALVLAKVNTDSEQMLAQQMGIQSLPTVALLKDGQIVDNFSGVKSLGEINTWLSTHIELGDVKPEPVVDNNVQVLIDNEQYEAALAALLALPPAQAVWQMMQVHLLMDNVNAAQTLYDGLSEEQLKTPEAHQAKARMQLAAVDASADLAVFKQQITDGQVEPAVQGLLSALQQDSTNTAIRQLLIAAFSLLNDPKLAAQYRRKMGSLLN